MSSNHLQLFLAALAVEKHFPMLLFYIGCLYNLLCEAITFNYYLKYFFQIFLAHCIAILLLRRFQLYFTPRSSSPRSFVAKAHSSGSSMEIAASAKSFLRVALLHARSTKASFAANSSACSGWSRRSMWPCRPALIGSHFQGSIRWSRENPAPAKSVLSVAGAGGRELPGRHLSCAYLLVR